MPSGLDRPTYVAGGNISPATFVKMSNAADFTVLACGDNEEAFGVSHDSTEEFPHTAASAFAASAGKELTVRQPGEKALLLLGGTVTRSEYVKSDANGEGVAVVAYNSAAPQMVAAQALRSGVAGEKIEVRVTEFHL